MAITNPYYEFDPIFAPGTKARSDAVNLQYQALQNAFDFLPGANDALVTGTATFAPETGAGDAYVVTMPDTRILENDGDEVVFFSSHANSGPATLEVDGLGPKAIVNASGNPLVLTDILDGICYIVRYDATNVRYQLVSVYGDFAAAIGAAALAMEWAVNPIDDDVTGFPGQYSALHWGDGASQAWAIQAEDSPIQITFGGDGATQFSSFHWAQKALAAAGTVKVLTDIPTATPPTTEAVTGNFEISDANDDDVLFTMGYNASNEAQLINFMHGGAVSIRGENTAGTTITMGSFDPDGAASLMYADTVHFETAVGGIRVVDGAVFIDDQAAAETPVASQGQYWVLEGSGGGDAFWSEVQLLAKYEGFDADTSYTELSVNAANATFNNTAEIDTAEANFDFSSALFNGGGSNDNILYGDIAAYDHGTGDWTHEGFVQFNNVPNFGDVACFLSVRGVQDVINIEVLEDSGPRFLEIQGNGWSERASISTPNTFQWYHWAVTREAGTIRAYWDGFYVVSDLGAADADMGNGTDGIRHGALDSFGTWTLDGWLDDYRLTIGTARYTGTGSITVPSSSMPTSAASPNTPMYTDDLGADYILNAASASEVQPGTVDGQVPLWDQSTDTQWEPSSVLRIRESGSGGSASVFWDMEGLEALTMTRGDGGNFATVAGGAVNTIRLDSRGASLGSVQLAFFSTGASRALIYNTHANVFFFDQESSGVTHALFGYPVAFETNKYPTAAPLGSAMFSSIAGTGMMMLPSSYGYPVTDPTGGIWRFNNPTAAADPAGPGFMRVNNADFVSATELYFDDFDTSGNQGIGLEKDDWFNRLVIGDLLKLSQLSDPTRWLNATIDSITDNTGWWTIGITPTDFNGTVFINAGDVQVQVQKAVASGANVVAGSVQGQVLRWDTGNSEYEIANGVFMEANASPPGALTGYLRFATTGTAAEQQAQMMWSALNTTSTHYFAQTSSDVDGFYCRTNSGAQTHAWGVVLNNIDSDVFRINESLVMEYDSGSGFNEVATVDLIGGAAGSINTDINTATPPTTEAVVGAYEIYDLAGDDLLADMGYSGDNNFVIQNYMHGGGVAIRAENTAGTDVLMLDLDPDGGSVLRGQTDAHMQVNGSQAGVIARAAGEVELYYANAIQLETTSIGLSMESGKNIDFSASMQIREAVIDMNGLAGGLHLVGQDEADDGFVLEDGARVTFQDLAFANHVYLRNEGIGGGSGTLTMRMDSSANFILAGPGLQLNNAALSTPVGLSVLTTPTRLNVSQSVRMQGGLYLQELSTADTDISANSQFWCEDTNPPRMMIADETGDHFVVGVAGGHAGPGQNVNVNNAHNFNTADHYAGNHISYFFDGGNDTVTLEDSSSTVNWPLYTSITIINAGSGVTTITEGSGTTLFDETGGDTVGGVTITGGVVTIFRGSTTAYIIWGSGIT